MWAKTVERSAFSLRTSATSWRRKTLLRVAEEAEAQGVGRLLKASSLLGICTWHCQLRLHQE